MIQSVPIGFNPIGVPMGAPRFQATAPQPQPISVDHRPEIASKSINYLADYSGCGYWRMIWPEHLLNAHQKAVIHSTTMMCLDERWYDATDSVRLQRQATPSQLKFARLLRDFSSRKDFRMLYEIDDIVFKEDIPEYNKFKPAFENPEIRDSAMKIMQLVDEITVTNKFMQEYYIDKTGNKNITVIPNYPPKWWMGRFYDTDRIKTNYSKHRKRPRILYSASGAHFDVDNRVKQRDDFHHVNDAVIKTLKDFQWVFIGAYPLTLAPYVQSGEIEFHQWQRLYEYPELLYDLKPTMFVAPLADNTFNKAKSDLKYIEACCYGVPIACQDLCTYGDAPYRFKTGDEMVDQIKRLVGNYTKYREASKASYKVANTRWLESDANIDKYAELYTHPYKSPKRININSLEENR
jgi:hypothetical protein